MIQRTRRLAELRAALKRARVTALIGPRQAGKTTLARAIVPPGSPTYFDLEDPRALARLAQPMTALAPLRGLVVIDEIQRRPDLFPILRVLADRRPLPSRFLILGSATPELLRQSSETLAGRLETIALTGFGLDEVGPGALGRLWRRGGFPPAYLARSEQASYVWRQQLVQTFLERDLPQLGISVPAATMLRFWTMLAHYHGGVWNAAEAARSLGVSEPAARRYLDLLSGLFMVRQLQPWHANLGKRQVKAPKVYVRDSGVLHALLGLVRERDILSHPKAGASWEGFAIEEAIERVTAGRGLLLGHPYRRRAGSAAHEGQPALRGGGQVPGRSAGHPLHAHRPGRLAAAPSDGPLPGRPALSAGSAHHRRAPGRSCV